MPELPLADVEGLGSRRAPWSEMVELIDAAAPHGFVIYFRNDVHPVMALAGDSADCVSYLMGNHTIAERMFRHDPRAMLYAPLHTVIWEEADGSAWPARAGFCGRARHQAADSGMAPRELRCRACQPIRSAKETMIPSGPRT